MHRRLSLSLGARWKRRSGSAPALPLVPQPAHAVLAGELAAGVDLLRRIASGDQAGHSDARYRLGRERCAADSTAALGGPHAGNAAPVSFIAISPGEAKKRGPPRSIAVEAFSKTGAIMVSRHFSLLAQHDQAHHQRFLQAEKSRQQRLEGAQRVRRTTDDIETGGQQRWASATWCRSTC